MGTNIMTHTQTNPFCPDCDVEMEEVECTTDFHDPSAYDGHGQYTEDCFQCPNCEEIFDARMFQDDGSDDYDDQD